MYMHIWDQKSQHASYFSSYVNDLFDLYVQSITREREREKTQENEEERERERGRNSERGERDFVIYSAC